MNGTLEIVPEPSVSISENSWRISDTSNGQEASNDILALAWKAKNSSQLISEFLSTSNTKKKVVDFCFIYPIFGFWFLVTFANKARINMKILCNLCLHFARQDKWARWKKRKENQATKVIKIPKSKYRTMGWNERNICKFTKVWIISFCVFCFEIWTLLKLEIWTLLKLEISNFRRVEIPNFRRVEIKRKSRWFKLKAFYLCTTF